jgi:predicted MFS family arabinose efflux permease
MVGNGLFGTLTALPRSEEGFDPTIIGVVLSCHSIGFIVGYLYGQRIIQRIGHIRCFTAFAAVLAVVCLILPVYVGPVGLYPYAAGVYALLAGFTLYRRSQRALVADPADIVAQPQTSQSSVIVTPLDPRAEEIE